MKKAFSLVELSIVLVILGLLTGGILAGQSLIRASELRAVSSEYNRYYTAVRAFRDKYFAFPGDMPNATRFWLKDSAASNCTSYSSATSSSTGTCDGDGDGIMPAQSNVIGASNEHFQIWRHLALAGMIEGNYTGVAYTADATDSVPGINCPGSKYPSAGWAQSIGTATIFASVTKTFAVTYPANVLILGSYISGGMMHGAVLKPEEAWNLDTKLDDGMPGAGAIIAGSTNSSFGSALACTNGASSTDFSTTYRLNNTTASCALYFLRAF